MSQQTYRYFVVQVRFGESGEPIRVPALCKCDRSACEVGTQMREYFESIGLTVLDVQDRGRATSEEAEASTPMEKREKAFATFLSMAHREFRRREHIAASLRQALAVEQPPRLH